MTDDTPDPDDEPTSATATTLRSGACPVCSNYDWDDFGCASCGFQNPDAPDALNWEPYNGWNI